ncbi:MAG: AAA family ATPase, partial [Planctomycetales bacterium]|nr:AAA family ATPase [Planctomycetales bacterium]
LNQAVVNYLDICDAPQKCEEFLTKMMIQVEELEGRFAEFDEFVVQLTEKREEIYNAFESRKIALIEARNKRAAALASAADRILKGIKTRVESFTSINDIHGYFASDLMIEKVRDIVEQLKALDDSVKVDDIHSRLKTIREDAVRQLKDRQELFEGGENVIRLGKHRFSVNVQQLDLTTVTREERMVLHLTGTNFFEPIEDAELNGLRDVWQQEVVSENRDVYRAEYLAYQMLDQLYRDPKFDPAKFAKHEESQLVADVQRFMGPRYQEAYSKGVHDHDAAKMLRALVEMKSTLGLLRFDPRARAMAVVYWRYFAERAQRKLIGAKLRGYGEVSAAFPDAPTQRKYVAQLHNLLEQFVNDSGLFEPTFLTQAAEYLFAELIKGDQFVISRTAADALDAFQLHLKSAGHAERFAASLAAVEKDPPSRFSLARDWAAAFLEKQANTKDASADLLDYVDELAILLISSEIDRQLIGQGRASREITGMVGSHAVIREGKYHLNFNQFIAKLDQFEHHVVPRYQRFVERKKELVEAARYEMRLDEFRPRVLTSFVRNRLIDEVYLPLIGDNLAKQVGVVGEGKRTDLMGLLLLVSPPGYGKTTLMEYVANRLGVIFMKINGPAIGHRVTSLDPTEASNAGAREEVEKLNLALEMGDNVMIYLDDIQHCNPELLQKFISLCDAQRKIEGVYKGRSRTYDLRGRKVVVVMAGNPYTESGEKFQIPDMLSNRADVYNLGEIIGETREVFEMSYLENALTSNPILSKLSSRSQKDVYSVIRLAEDADRASVSFEANYSAEELNEMVSVMKKMMRVRDVILTVNREYIRSAAQADAYRTEPPFKLQGSYRNMNRISEKVMPIMNDRELQTLILSNYENDSQTLTSDNEANMLKFKELVNLLTPEEKNRWESIKSAFTRNVKLQGVDTSDKFGQAIVQLSSVNDGLDAIRRALAEGVGQMLAPRATDEEDELAVLRGQLNNFQLSLDAISQAMSGGVSQLAALAERISNGAAGNASGLSSDDLRALLEEFRSTSPQPVDISSALTPKVTVQHKVPRVVLDVVRAQFELMQSWMAPVLNAANLQSSDIQRLQASIDRCLNNYAGLLEDLEAARPSNSPGRK